jgi:hypothetical protein
MTSGWDYRVWASDERIRTEWIRVPSQANWTYVVSSLNKDGAIWTGTTWLGGTCQTGAKVKQCYIKLGSEIDKLSDTRIDGRAQTFKTFDCRKCEYHDLVRVEALHVDS